MEQTLGRETFLKTQPSEAVNRSGKPVVVPEDVVAHHNFRNPPRPTPLRVEDLMFAGAGRLRAVEDSGSKDDQTSMLPKNEARSA